MTKGCLFLPKKLNTVESTVNTEILTLYKKCFSNIMHLNVTFTTQPTFWKFNESACNGIVFVVVIFSCPQTPL